MTTEKKGRSMPCVKLKKDKKRYFIELPSSELRVLEVLAGTSEAMIVPRIADKLNSSEATIYTLVRRLEKKNLITSESVAVPVLGTTMKRIIWEKNFDSMEVIPVLRELPQ